MIPDIAALDRRAQAIRLTRWDVADYDEVRDLHTVHGTLDEAMTALGEASPVGADIVADLFASFHKSSPRPNPDLDARHAVNRKIIEEAMASDYHSDSREFTVGDPIASAVATIATHDRLIPMYERLGDLQKEADEAQQAEDDVRSLLEGAGEGEGVDPAALEAARAKAGQAQAQLDQAVDEATPRIGRAVRSGLREAAGQTAAMADNARGWDLSTSEASKMNPAERLAMAQQMASPRLRQIAEKLGRLKNTAWAERSSKTVRGPDELHDIELGNDLARLLPSELMGLVHEDLELDFFRRYTERQLLQYELRSVEREAKGGIVYLPDHSGSMAGEPETWAAALGLAFGAIAKLEKRSFYVVAFGGPGELTEFDFTSPTDHETGRMLAYASHFRNASGTDFCSPLDRALDLLEAEHRATGKLHSDILLATDGYAHVPADWQKTYGERVARLEARVFGIAIGTDPTAEPLYSLCSGRVTSITDVVGGGDMKTIFRQLV